MLISLHHDQRASLAETLQFVGLRLDLNDYDAYDLPKEILQQATNLMIPQRQSVNVSNTSNVMRKDNGANVSSDSSARIYRSNNFPSINLNLNDNIGSCTITSRTSPSHFFLFN
ncbi:unnamed protein product [Rotaria sp. Silwood1]|nr:unnamed protein product [Rotaria sp. Silwood1]